MSEKRFVAEQVDVVNEDEIEVWDIVFDTENTYAFMVRDTDTASGLCDLLNDQQSTIKYLTIEKHQADKRFQTIIAELKKENEQLEQKIKDKNEYQRVLEAKIRRLKDRIKVLEK